MRVLILSTDRKLLEKESAVFERHLAYSREVDALDVLVLGGNGELREEKLNVRGIGFGFPILRGAAAFFKALRLIRPDVLTVQDPFENGLVAWLIARRWGVPLHVQVHTDFVSPYFVRHSLLNRVRLLIARFVLRRAARVRVVSESIKETLQTTNYGLQTTPISVLPIFVDVEKYAGLVRTKHSRFKIALLWVGRLEKEKNPLMALHVLEIARRSGHDAGLIIVGSGREKEVLRNYVRERGLERFVEFAGHQENLSPYLNVADILLVTSHYEGYGMITIEALAAGVPVLSTDVGIAREAGAIVVKHKKFGRALLDWIAHGPRKGELQSYPYASREEYVRAWCEDVQSTAL